MTDTTPAPVPEIFDPLPSPTVALIETVSTPAKKRGRPVGSLGHRKKSVIAALAKKSIRARPHGSKNKQRFSLKLVV